MNPSLSAYSAARRHLIAQLVYFDEQYTQFYDTYLYGRPDAERQPIEKAVRRYIDLLSAMLPRDDEALAERLKRVALIGSRVVLRYEDDGGEESFTIVHPAESDADNDRISFLSPIGWQLLGRERGDAIALEVPNGTLNVVLLDVKYAHIGGFGQE